MINSKKSKSTYGQLIYYGLIGLLSNSVGYCFFILMTNFNVGHKLAMTCLYLICALISYFSNWKLTFCGIGDFTLTSRRFLCFHLLGYLLNFFLLLIFVDHLGYSYYAIEAIAILIVAGYLFFAFKFYVFSNPIEPIDEKMSLLQ